jgi:hypothetical protein
MNQAFKPLINRRSANRDTRLRAPEGAEASAMPAQQCLRFNDHNGASNGRRYTGEPGQYHLIQPMQLDPTAILSLQDQDLMPQEHNLNHKPRFDLNS